MDAKRFIVCTESSPLKNSSTSGVLLTSATGRACGSQHPGFNPGCDGFVKKDQTSDFPPDATLSQVAQELSPAPKSPKEKEQKRVIPFPQAANSQSLESRACQFSGRKAQEVLEQGPGGWPSSRASATLNLFFFPTLSFCLLESPWK